MAVAATGVEVTPTSVQDIEQLWKTRITQGREAQKPFVPVWLSNLAFAAGQQWLVWHDESRRLRKVDELDPRFRGRVLITADRINEYRQAQLGELNSGDDRKELLAAQASDTAEEDAKHLNQAVAYAWEHEWNAQQALQQARAYAVDLGLGAIRCRWDPARGPVAGHIPIGPDGKPVTDPATVDHLELHGMLPDGSLPRFQPVNEGRTSWEPYSAIQCLTPPGIHHEDLFPWEILVRPVPLGDLIADYPAAQGLSEDTDIASAMGLSTGQTVRDLRSQGQTGTRLRGHVWLYTCFTRPSRKYPDGQKLLIASNQYRLIAQQDQLDYRLPNGDPHTGVVYFHWWRLNDRFYSRSFVEPLKDPQRAINLLETFKNEIVMRGGPKVFVKDGNLIDNPQGVPMEVIRMNDNSQQPFFFPGVGPGEWMNIEKAGHVDNLAHASTLSAVRLGENPQNVDTYAQLALLNENEAGKRTVIVTDHDRQIATLQKLGVNDIVRYWPDEKNILVAGDEGAFSEQVFAKSKVPKFFTVKVAEGAAQPRSQGAELKKIDAIWAAAVQCGLAVQNPAAWGKWYVDSVQAGQAQDIPELEQDSQVEMAMFENFLMLDQAVDVPVADYDILQAHVPKHREAQDQARASGDVAAFQRIDRHIQQHILQTQVNAAKVAAAQQAPSPAGAAAAAGGAQNGAGPAVFAGPDFVRLAGGN